MGVTIITSIIGLQNHLDKNMERKLKLISQTNVKEIMKTMTLGKKTK